MTDDKRPRTGRSGSESPAEERAGMSRRAFLRGGAAGALASGGLFRSSELEAAADDPRTGFVGPDAVKITLEVDGKPHQLEVEPRMTLLDVLRDELDATAPKKVCDRATCGACTVMEDSELIYACTRLAIESDQKAIITAAGLGNPEVLHRVQSAFIENDAQQCGFCTPGFVVATAALFSEFPTPSLGQIRRGLGGNFCRCGTYAGIQQVVHLDSAAASLKGTR